MASNMCVMLLVSIISRLDRAINRPWGPSYHHSTKPKPIEVPPHCFVIDLVKPWACFVFILVHIY